MTMEKEDRQVSLGGKNLHGKANYNSKQQESYQTKNSNNTNNEQE